MLHTSQAHQKVTAAVPTSLSHGANQPDPVHHASRAQEATAAVPTSLSHDDNQLEAESDSDGYQSFTDGDLSSWGSMDELCSSDSDFYDSEEEEDALQGKAAFSASQDKYHCQSLRCFDTLSDSFTWLTQLGSECVLQQQQHGF